MTKSRDKTQQKLESIHHNENTLQSATIQVIHHIWLIEDDK